MKRIVFALFLCMMLSIGTAAQAENWWVGSVYNDVTNAYTPNVYNFDWSSSGSGVAVGTAGPGAPIQVGQEFWFLYQANLVGLNDINGQSIAFPGLNTTLEYTAVAAINEVVTSVTPIIVDPDGIPGSGDEVNLGVTALFTTLPGGTWAMFHDGPGNIGVPPHAPNSNVPTGMGFDDGDPVANGTLDPGKISTFTLTWGPDGIPITNDDLGVGSTILTGLVTNASGLYLLPNAIIFDLRFEGTLNQPALDSFTTDFFVSRAGEGAYAPYHVNFGADGTYWYKLPYPGVPADDIDGLFKVDGSSKFSVAVPEPSTILLLGAGLLGLSGFARKRMKK